MSSALAIVILGFLAVMANNLELEARSRVGLSGNAMVVTASIVVFRPSLVYVGPLLVGALSGLYFPDLRERAWYKVALNSSFDALALLAAMLTFWGMTGSGHVSQPLMVLAVAVSSSAYLLVNTLLVAIPVAITCEERYLGVVRELSVLSLGNYPFALLGLGLGWVYLEFGAFVVPLLVVPILIARGTFKGYLELQAAQDQTIETLIRALEAKDRYTAGHAQRVATFAGYVGQELNFGPKRLERLRYAALMHDIGKLVVPNQLLNKPGRLTEAEFARVRRHEEVSVALLGRIDFLAPVAPNTTSEAATRSVEEETGAIEPGIIMVADAFDAMTSTRSYRKALTQEIAFEELRKNAGRQFRGDCVEALITGIERRGERYGDGFEVDDEEWEVAPPVAGVGSAGLGDLLPEEKATR